jgi:tetratricopeptide (TPR) repeat protein
MQEKIALYEEVLALEPGSRLFFALAEMYLSQGMPEKAEATLRRGIANHPDHLEAKLLLLEVLDRSAKQDEMIRMAAPLITSLRGCSALWKAWEAVDRDAKGETATLFRLLGRALSGNGVSWDEIITTGVNQVCRDQAATVADDRPGAAQEVQRGDEAPDVADFDELSFPAPEEDLDAEEIDLTELEEDVKTRTLADLLAYQDEFDQALRIYEQLYEGATTPEDKDLFRSRMDEMHEKMKQQGVEESGEPGESGGLDVQDPVLESEDKNQTSSRVVDTLEALADRLDRRDTGDRE